MWFADSKDISSNDRRVVLIQNLQFSSSYAVRLIHLWTYHIHDVVLIAFPDISCLVCFSHPLNRNCQPHTDSSQPSSKIDVFSLAKLSPAQKHYRVERVQKRRFLSSDHLWNAPADASSDTHTVSTCRTNRSRFDGGMTYLKDSKGSSASFFDWVHVESVWVP